MHQYVIWAIKLSLEYKTWSCLKFKCMGRNSGERDGNRAVRSAVRNRFSGGVTCWVCVALALITCKQRNGCGKLGNCCSFTLYFSLFFPPMLPKMELLSHWGREANLKEPLSQQNLSDRPWVCWSKKKEKKTSAAIAWHLCMRPEESWLRALLKQNVQCSLTVLHSENPPPGAFASGWSFHVIVTCVDNVKWLCFRSTAERAHRVHASSRHLMFFWAAMTTRDRKGSSVCGRVYVCVCVFRDLTVAHWEVRGISTFAG